MLNVRGLYSMLKNTITMLGIMLLHQTFAIHAQNIEFEFQDPSHTLYLQNGESMHQFEGTIRNKISNEIEAFIIKNAVTMPENWNSFICTKDGCNPPDVDTVSIILAPEEESDVHININCTANPIEAQADMKVFALCNGESHLVDLELTTVNNSNKIQTFQGKHVFDSDLCLRKSVSGITVSWEKPNYKPSRCIVFNSRGQQIVQKDINTGLVTPDIVWIPLHHNGVYILTFHLCNGMSLSKTLVYTE